MSLRSINSTAAVFLSVGALTGLGLTLGDYFHMQQAQAEQKHYDFIEAKAKSVIHIFLPGGIAHQESFDPKPYAPIEYRGELGIDRDEDPRRGLLRNAAANGPDRRQDHRHPLDDARRSGPRARHAQHVHRLAAPARRSVYPSMGSVVSHEYGPRNNLPPYVCIPNAAERVRRHRLPQLVVWPVQPGRRPGQQAASRFAT